MSELVPVLFRLRTEQRDWLKEQPEGMSEALRAILDDVMANGTRAGFLVDERRAVIAGDSLSFAEFVQIHILSRPEPYRTSYIRSPGMSDYLQAFGRTRTELQAEVKRLEPPPSPPSQDGGQG